MKYVVYVSDTAILNQSKSEVVKRIQHYLRITPYCACKLLKGRKVTLERYLEANTPRKDATKRLRTFFVAIDIIKRSHSGTQRMHNKLREYEIVGYDSTGVEVRVHIREEIERGDRILYLISSFSSAKRENPLP